MKSVLISIQPKWCSLIASGEKTVEVRKNKPKLETPFKCYIYMTKSYDTLFGYGKPKKLCVDGGKVIGEFVCDELSGGFWISPFSDYLQMQSCLSYDEICDYANGKPIFSWHISDLVIYDTPRELSEFCRNGECAKCGWLEEGKCYKNDKQNNINKHRATRPPQSWCYVEE